MHLLLYGDSDAAQSALREVVCPGGLVRRKNKQWGNAGVAAPLHDACMPNQAGPACGEHPAGGVVLMDELGWPEQSVHGFRNRLLEALDAPWRMLGVLQEQDDGFLRQVANHPRVKTMKVTSPRQLRAAVDYFLTPPSLADALLVGKGITALVGGGGKTTLMHRLGAQLSQRGSTVLCTSTHVLVPDMTLLIDPSPQDVTRALERERLIFIGGWSQDRRLGPCELVSTGEIGALADYIIVEADGAKRLPFKAPAEHEPVLPPGTAHVVAVAGMSGMHRPIREVAHRPERYAALAGKGEEENITPTDCARVLSHAQGQKKGVTGSFSVLLNQAETPQGFAAAAGCARELAAVVVIASLQMEQPVLEQWRNQTCAW